MASVKIPTFPSFDFSKLEMPKFGVPQIDTEAVTKVATDAVYVTIGLAALAFQKAQVRRQELSKALTDQFGTGKAQISEVVDTLEARLASLDARFIALEGKLDVTVEDLEKRLPERAGALLGSAHEAAKTARKQVRSMLRTAA